MPGMASTGPVNIDHSVKGAGFPTALNAYVGATLLELFLFGLYTILFAISIYVLWFNKSGRWFLLLMSVAMYVIATSDIVYTVWLLFKTLLGTEQLMFLHLYPKYSFFVTNNLVGHGLLLYRCVVVWGHRWWLTGSGVLGLIGVTGVGYALEGTSMESVSRGWVYLSSALAYNLLLTGLTAGRIIYITRWDCHLLSQALRKRYITTIAVLVESGVLYTMYLGLNLAFQKHPVANTVLDCAGVQVVGIVPTLIMVQVGLGRTVAHGNNDEEAVVWLRTTQQPYPEDPSTLLTHHRPSTSMSGLSIPPPMRPRANS